MNDDDRWTDYFTSQLRMRGGVKTTSRNVLITVVQAAKVSVDY